MAEKKVSELPSSNTLTNCYILGVDANGVSVKIPIGTLITNLLNQKQDKLTSGTNIKTINGSSVLGAGNIVIQGGGGGVTDYSELDGKPQINGNTLNGNKSSQELGLQDALVSGNNIKTVNNTSLLGSGNITIEGEPGRDGQDAVNPFKGWYPSAASLPSSPKVGDYAYVKGSNAGDPAAIYECTTAGTWSNSGETADTSNIQTFASGEEVNSVGIVKLNNPAENDVASAKEAMYLKDTVGYEIEEELTIKTFADYKVNNQSGNYKSDGTWTVSNNVKSTRIDLTGYNHVRFYGWIGKAAQTQCYAFQNANGVVIKTFNYANDPNASSGRIAYYSIDIPVGAKYLVFVYYNVNYQNFSDKCVCFLRKEKNVKRSIADVVDNTKLLAAEDAVLSGNSIPFFLSTYKGLSTGFLDYNASTSRLMIIVPFKQIKSIYIKDTSWRLAGLFFVKGELPTSSYINAIDYVDTTAMYVDVEDIAYLNTVDADRLVILLRMEDASADLSGVTSVDDKIGFTLKSTNVVTTSLPLLCSGTLNTATGYYPTGLSSYANRAHTPLFYPCHISVKIVTPNIGGQIHFYDKNLQFLGYTSYSAISTAQSLHPLRGAKYFRLAINGTLGDLPTHVDVQSNSRLEGVFQKNTATGYQPFTFCVNVKSNAVPSSSVSEVVQQYVRTTDSGMLHLPASYSNDGAPTPLIIYLHGAADKYTSSSTTFANNNPYAPEWDAAGYAQMDVDMIPDIYPDTPMPDTGNDYECVLAAYNWCVEHFNIDRRGVYLIGRSRGAQAVLTILGKYKENELPVMCALSNAGANTLVNYYVYRASASAAWQSFCDICGLPSVGRPTVSGSGAWITKSDVQQYLRDNLQTWWSRMMTGLPLVRSNNTDYKTALQIFNLIATSYTDDGGESYCNWLRQLEYKSPVPLRFDWCYGDTTQDWTTGNYSSAMKEGFVGSVCGNAVYRQWPTAPNNPPVGAPSNPHYHERMNFINGDVTLLNGATITNPSMARLEWLLWCQQYDFRFNGNSTQTY